MSASVRIARPFGIEVRVHASFLLVLIWVAGNAGRAAGAVAALWSVAFVLGLFFCVVLHELGHSRVAMAFGIPVRRITLYPIGGVAAMARIPRRPWQELLMALAGPAVNVVLAAGMIALRGRWPDLANMEPYPTNPTAFFDMLLLANLVLAAFNLIPAFPMDGGRVLRSLLALRRPYAEATAFAAALGQLFAVALGVLGLRHGNPFLVLMAGFLIFVARREAQAARLRARIETTRPADWMQPLQPTLAPDDPLARCVALLQSSGRADFPVLFDGRVVGILPRARWRRALREQGPDAPVGSAMEGRFFSVPADAPGTEDLLTLLASRQPLIPVLRNGQPVGILLPEFATAPRNATAPPGRWSLDLGPA